MDLLEGNREEKDELTDSVRILKRWRWVITKGRDYPNKI